MAYKAKFLHFKTKQSYNTERNKTAEGSDERKVFDAYISFIDEGPTICTWGKEYKCSIDEDKVNEILEEKGVGEKEVEIISIPYDAWAAEEYEFTTSGLYDQIDSAVENNKIIVARSTNIDGDALFNINAVFYHALRIKTNDASAIALSGSSTTVTDNTGRGYITLITLVVESATNKCTLRMQDISPSDDHPKKNSGTMGEIGTSTEYARADHAHPVQTTITGNAGTATKLETARNINLTGAVTGSASFDGSDDISINTTIGSIDASKITSGTLNAERLPEIPIEKLPAGALERLVIVENQAARYQLTTSDVQEGDTVKQEDTGIMYFVVDTTNLANENGYKVYTAGAATSVPWSGVTSKPSTLSGYGISSTDSYLAKPTTFEWVNGDTEGPTGTLTGNNVNVSIPAIPEATANQSGIVLVGSQEFTGPKTFYGNVTISNNCDAYSFIASDVIGDCAHFSQIENRGGGTTPIYIGSGAEYSISYDGSEYTGNAATATKVKNKLTFTGAVTGEYDGSSTLTVNIPDGGSDIPIALPNPYPLTFTGAVTKSYDGSSAVTVNIPGNSMTYRTYLATATTQVVEPGYSYYPTAWQNANQSVTLTIRVTPSAFSADKPDAVIVVQGTKPVIIVNTESSTYGGLFKQSNIMTSGTSSDSYRIYAFSYLGGSGTITGVAVNCSEYTK